MVASKHTCLRRDNLKSSGYSCYITNLKTMRYIRNACAIISSGGARSVRRKAFIH